MLPLAAFPPPDTWLDPIDLDVQTAREELRSLIDLASLTATLDARTHADPAIVTETLRAVLPLAERVGPNDFAALRAFTEARGRLDQVAGRGALVSGQDRSV